MKRKIVLDLETISDIDLKKHGVRRYVASPHTRISVLSFFDFKTDKLITIYDETISMIKNELTEEEIGIVKDVFTNPNLVVIAHNANFEKNVLEAKLNKLLADNLLTHFQSKPIQFPEYQYFCTMTWANIMRSPAKLESAAKYFKLEIKKDTKGASLMRKICSPMTEKTVKGTVNGLDYTAVNIMGVRFKGGVYVYERMGAYCEQDVRATFKLFNHLNSKDNLNLLNGFLPTVKAGKELTDDMNIKGVGLDKDLLDKLLHVKDIIYNEADAITAKYFEIESFQKKEKIKAKIKEQTGIAVHSLGKSEISKLLKTSSVPEKLKEGLEQYARLNVTSLNKVQKAADINIDNHLYDLFRYCGAYATGRWTSFDFQLQNLPRSTQSDPVKAIEFINKYWKDDEVILANPEKFVDGIRGLVVPEKGHKFYITDLKGIEARLALYNSGYSNIVDQMHNEGLDVYVKMAQAVYDKEDISKAERQNIGKPGHLGCQFGQGHVSLQAYAENMGSKMNEDEAKKTVNAFRKMYPNIVKEWRYFDNMVRRCFFKREPLKIKLKSGRVLNYGLLDEVPMKCKFTGKDKKTVCYYDGNKWKAIYGSRVFQHTIQAEARDIFLAKMSEMKQAGYDIRMTVHDEVVIQVPEGVNKEKLDEDWAAAGRTELEHYWTNLKIGSDSIILDRYWSH